MTAPALGARGWLVAAWAIAATAPARAQSVPDRRGIVTVQQRAYPKDGRFELTLVGGVVPNDAFRTYLPVGARLAYHLSERFAVEGGAVAALALDTGLRRFLEEQDSDLAARSRDRQQARADAALLWSPLYGKVAAGRRIVHFDGYLLGGGGVLVTTADPDDPALSRRALAPEVALGAGVRAFLSRRWVLHGTVRQLAYLRPESAGGAGGVGTPTEVTLGVGALLGAGRAP